MVLISSTKYACETCIKGHRSSTCKHTDRPLFEIKKKGRPVTQCEHCRELRKTKQVHVKCVCEVHEDGISKTSSCSKKKASNKVPENAAFPHGLPQNLEATVAIQSFPERQPSESEHNPGCTCKSDGICNCFTPRKSAPRRRRKTISDLRHEFDGNVENPSRAWNTNLPLASMSSSSLTHVLARIAELRPVLPKPSTSGPCHDPSSGVAHTHTDRHHHTHENMFFSPYGRAYEYTHGSHHEHGHESEDPSHQSLDPGTSVLLDDENYPEPTALPLWNSFAEPASLPSTCACGDACSCPGCAQHAVTTTSSFPAVDAFNTCTNPGACNACLDYTILSLPNPLPPNTALSIFESQPSQSIDDWLRQVSDVTTSLPSTSDFDTLVAVNVKPGYVQPPWETYQLPDNPEIEQVPDIISNEGIIPCICLPDECFCDTSSGEDSVQLVTSTCMMFTPLDKRPPCCQTISPLDAPVFSDLPEGNENLLISSVNSQSFLAAPQLPRSRSSSGSSYSTHHLEQLFPRRSSEDDSGFHISPLDYFSNELSVASSQPSFSPTHSDHDGSAVYPVSNPDSDGSFEDYSQYDPMLEGVQQYRESYVDGLD